MPACKTLRFFLVTALLVTCLNSALRAETQKALTLVVDDACPMVCVGGEQKGIFVDVLELVLSEHGYQLKLVARPWARSILELKTGKVDLLPTIDPMAYPNLLYPAESIFDEYACFYGRQQLAWTYQGFESLKSVKLGLIHYELIEEETSLYHEITSNADQLNILTMIPSQDNVIERALRLIKSGRVDVMILNRSVMAYSAKTAAEAHWHQHIKNFACLPRAMHLTVAISRQHPQAQTITQYIETGVKKLKASGDYQAILAKYGQALQTIKPSYSP